MAKKEIKDQSVLGLIEVDSPPDLNSGHESFEFLGRPLTHEQRRILEEYARQALIMEAIAHKTVLAQDEIASLYQHATSDFFDTVDCLFELRKEAVGKEYQVYIDEWTKLAARILAKHLMGTVEVGATNIATMIQATLELPPEKRSLWNLLFG